MKKICGGFFSRDSEPKRYCGDTVDLIEKYRVSERTAFDGIPTVYYDIYLHNTNHKVGKCDLRLKLDERMYYYGHVGYNVLPKERGHHYAYHACKILFEIARDEFGFEELYLTCNPDNEASYKTLKKLNGELIEVAEIPHYHELYSQGDRFKCVFRYKVKL
ncbi:MAG: GNAT family N-acetyltransferase [Erysipelotrichaceae bacterium]|nr:GNAT family N-acetyltransferase [Erysipelotrichaceae bacterium]